MGCTGSYSNIPAAIVYVLKGDYRLRVRSTGVETCSIQTRVEFTGTTNGSKV